MLNLIGVYVTMFVCLFVLDSMQFNVSSSLKRHGCSMRHNYVSVKAFDDVIIRTYQHSSYLHMVFDYYVMASKFTTFLVSFALGFI